MGNSRVQISPLPDLPSRNMGKVEFDACVQACSTRTSRQVPAANPRTRTVGPTRFVGGPRGLYLQKQLYYPLKPLKLFVFGGAFKISRRDTRGRLTRRKLLGLLAYHKHPQITHRSPAPCRTSELHQTQSSHFKKRIL